MRFTELLRELQSRDIRVFIEDAQLRCEAPRGALSEELRTAIASHKREIYELLSPRISNERKIERIARGRLYPLSFAQQRLWFLHQLDPNGSDYNIPTAMRLKGDLNVEALHRSLKELVRRHEILCTTYRMDGDTPVQYISDDANLPMPVVDLCSYSPTTRPDGVNQIAWEQAYAPFDLARGPVIRAKLLIAPSTEGTREHVLIMVFHHIVTDDWSSALIYRELATIYSAFAAGRPSPL